MTVVAFGETQAADGLTAVGAIADAMVQTSDDFMTLPAGIEIHNVISRGANLARTQIKIANDQVPIIDTTEVSALAADIIEEETNPLRYKVLGNQAQKVSVKVDNGNNNEAQCVVLTIGKDNEFVINKPNVNYKIIRGASTTAGVAYTWITAAVTWDSNLPASGTAKLLGMRVQSASGIAARIVAGTRVGVPTQHVQTGKMFWFKTPTLLDLSNMPSVEILSTTTTASHVIELALA